MTSKFASVSLLPNNLTSFFLFIYKFYNFNLSIYMQKWRRVEGEPILSSRQLLGKNRRGATHLKRWVIIKDEDYEDLGNDATKAMEETGLFSLAQVCICPFRFIRLLCLFFILTCVFDFCRGC